ncbi:RhoGAP domain containing protein [Tritrichomonas foetus]|uniref:RhoGAP domain containing protein n=1 Tax=Tritrichomonas foetus TaxID=1144522 RepID=A0A1J4KG25_9EUKA|nr:RhoGAP domain containing protein [Tritrichomonas foetus]|eukprot:OHT10369.1 RhoGAP domain containing protein [Tritrichomonas foetus]
MKIFPTLSQKISSSNFFSAQFFGKTNFLIYIKELFQNINLFYYFFRRNIYEKLIKKLKIRIKNLLLFHEFFNNVYISIYNNRFFFQKEICIFIVISPKMADLKFKKGGFLNKMGGTVKSWKRRYFILRDMSLEYFKDQSLKEQLGTIPIVDCTISIEEQGDNQPGFYFMLKLPPTSNAKGPEFLICAETDEDRRSWINAINMVNVVTVFNNELYAALKVNPKQPGSYLPIPFFVVKAIKYLDENALRMEGIYRLNGSSQKIDNLVTMINANVNVEFSDANSTTGLLKLYMRTLKTPILRYENIPALKNIVSVPEPQQVPLLRSLLRSLPIPNYVFLAYFFAHLLRINQHADSNLMKVQAITVCIGPSLIWSQEGQPNDAYTESNIQQIICTLMLENYDKLFTSNPLMAYQATGGTKFYKLINLQDTKWPYTLDAPAGAIVQAIAHDKFGWTICVYNDKWGCVNVADLAEISSNREFLSGISAQHDKWRLSYDEMSMIGLNCPEASKLYEILLQRLRTLREKAARLTG